MSLQEVFGAHAQMNKLYYMIMMTVNPDYRGRGIASQLVECCFEVCELLVKSFLRIKYFQLAKLAKCDGALVVATSPFTMKIFEKRMTEFK